MTFYQTQQHSVDYQKSILTIWTIYITKFLNIFTMRFK